DLLMFGIHGNSRIVSGFPLIGKCSIQTNTVHPSREFGTSVESIEGAPELIHHFLQHILLVLGPIEVDPAHFISNPHVFINELEKLLIDRSRHLLISTSTYVVSLILNALHNV